MSFLRDMTRERKVQSKVLPTLTGLGGRSTATPVAPLSSPDEAPPSVLEQSQSNAVLPAADTGAAPATSAPGANVPAPNFEDLFTPIVAPVDVSDTDFYRRTGRAPTASDRMLLDTKRRFFSSKGRLPSVDELMYEAQRGIVGQQDDGVTRQGL